MDNVRLLLWGAFGAALWFTYRAWTIQYPPEPMPAAPTAEETFSEGAPAGADELPPLNQPGTRTPQALPPVSQTAEPGRPIQVRTDVLDAVIDAQGGDLVRVDLLEYPLEKGADTPVRLLDFAGTDRWVYQTGLRGTSGGPEPNHLAAFSAADREYVLGSPDDELTVTLNWESSGPLRASKTYTFRRGQYGVDLDIVVENAGDVPWSGAAYAQLLRRHNPVGRSFVSVDSYSFTGPVLYDGDQFEKLDVDDLLDAPVTQSLAGGWHASIQHHFLAAAVPPPAEEIHYQAAARGEEYLLTALTNLTEIAPGERRSFPFTLFVGPKLQEQLAEAGPAPGTYRRLRHLHLPGAAAVLGAGQDLRVRGQLGLVNRDHDLPDQAAVLQAYRDQRPVDGEDAQAPTADEGASGDLQGQPRTAEPAHDGTLQAGKGQSGRGLFADHHPDAVLSSPSTGC